MKEMLEQDRQTADAPRARRKRVARNVGRVIELLGGAFWMLLFILALRTGYLSPIGVAVGALFAGSAIAAPVLGWAGRTRLEWVSVAVHLGITILVPLAALATLLWPERDGVWRPYRFDDELAALETKRAVPDAENVALRYDALFARMDEKDEPDFIFSGVTIRDELGTRPWKGADYPQASQWLDSQAPLIEGLLEMGRMEKCRWPVQADVYDAYTVPYRKLNHSVKLLWAAGNRDLGEGRVDHALAEYFCILRIADHLHQQPSQVDFFTAYGRERFVLQMIRYALVQSNLSNENVAEIARHLPPAADPWPQESERLLEYEKLHFMNLLGRLYEVNDAGRVRFARRIVISPKDEQERESPMRFPWVYWLMNMPRDPDGVRPIVDRYVTKLDLRTAPERLSQLDRNHESGVDPVFHVARMVCNFYRWWAETSFFDEELYAYPRERCIQAVTQRRGTWLVLGLRHYREAHGGWPQTLDAIAAYVPSEAFFDPTAGEAFIYARDGDSFRLYSKGPNRMDDGGRSGYVHALDKIEDDIPIWPPPPPKPIPSDEEIRKELEEIYGREYAETYMRDHRSDKR